MINAAALCVQYSDIYLSFVGKIDVWRVLCGTGKMVLSRTIH